MSGPAEAAEHLFRKALDTEQRVADAERLCPGSSYAASLRWQAERTLGVAVRCEERALTVARKRGLYRKEV